MPKQVAEVCFPMPGRSVNGDLQNTGAGRRIRSGHADGLVGGAEASLAQEFHHTILPGTNCVLHNYAGGQPQDSRDGPAWRTQSQGRLGCRAWFVCHASCHADTHDFSVVSPIAGADVGAMCRAAPIGVCLSLFVSRRLHGNTWADARVCPAGHYLRAQRVQTRASPGVQGCPGPAKLKTCATSVANKLRPWSGFVSTPMGDSLGGRPRKPTVGFTPMRGIIARRQSPAAPQTPSHGQLTELASG